MTCLCCAYGSDMLVHTASELEEHTLSNRKIRHSHANEGIALLGNRRFSEGPNALFCIHLLEDASYRLRRVFSLLL